MKKSYDTNQPLETFVKKIEDAIMLEDAAGEPYTGHQIEYIAYMILSRTGVFHDEWKLWRRRNPATKTWRLMKQEFAESHQDLVEVGQTTGEDGYHNVANSTMPEQDLSLIHI